jgi:hypothetical protein
MRTEANTRGRRYPRAMALVGLVTIITAASLRLQADTGTCGVFDDRTSIRTRRDESAQCLFILNLELLGYYPELRARPLSKYCLKPLQIP